MKTTGSKHKGKINRSRHAKPEIKRQGHDEINLKIVTEATNYQIKKLIR